MTWNLTNAVAGWTQTAEYSGTVTVTTCYPGQGTFTNLAILGDCMIEGGVWTQEGNPVGSSVHERRLAVSIGGDFILGASATINVTAKGFSPQRGPAPGGSTTTSTGASHGGLGAPGYSWVKAKETYGSVFAPECLGSGGRTAEYGGGAVWLVVGGAAMIDGSVLANANDATVYRRAGSSGGSVYIHATSFSGIGSLEARGGYSWGNTGAGGGGRIAVVLTGDDDFGGVAMRAYGKTSTYNASAAGTVYLQTADQVEGEGVLIVDNNNLITSYCLNTWDTATLIPRAGACNGPHDLSKLASVIVRNTGILALNVDTVFDFGKVPIVGGGASDITKWRTANAAPADAEIVVKGTNFVAFPNPFVISNYTLSLDVPVRAVGDWTIAAHGALSHSGNHNPIPGQEEFRLDLELVGDLVVEAGGAIEANTRGYFNGCGPAPGAEGQGTRGSSHGGRGGFGRNLLTAPSLPCYGSPRFPTTLGSGGNVLTSGSRWRHGGGAIHLKVRGTTTVDGVISSRQILPTVSRSAGAAGGSIQLETEVLQGAGAIEAWGDSSDDSGGGGGGRIAVRLTSSESFGAVTIAAGGNSGGGNSAAGTVYLETASQSGGRGALVVDTAYATITNVVTELPASGTPEGDELQSASLNIAGASLVALTGDLRVGDLFIDTSTACRLYLKGHTLKVDTYRHPDWGDEAWVVYDGGQIVWRGGTLLTIR